MVTSHHLCYFVLYSLVFCHVLCILVKCTFCSRDYLCAGSPVHLLCSEGNQCGDEQPCTPLPHAIEDWVHIFLSWSPECKSKALDAMISVCVRLLTCTRFGHIYIYSYGYRCDSSQLKYMLEKIR